MGKRRTWRSLLAVLAVALVAAVGFAPRAALAAEGNVAMIGDTGYPSLSEAIKAVEPGTPTTIKIVEDNVTFSSFMVSEGVDLTLDLGGRTIKSNGGGGTAIFSTGDNKTIIFRPFVTNKGRLTIENGTIQFTGANDGVYNTGTLIIGEAATLESTLKVPSGPSANRNYSTLVINDSGHITTGGNLSSPANSGIATYGGEVEVTGGTIATGDDYGAAIDIYSSDNTVNGNPANVTISGGTITSDIVAVSTNNVQSASSSLTITGGTISTDSTSIYWPTSGTLTIGDKETGEGPTITSQIGSAIEMCSGSLNVYGGTLKGGVGQGDEAIYNTQSLHDAIVQGNMTSGYIGIGDAITVFANRASSYAAAPLSVNISGGTFSSAKNYGIRLFDNKTFDGVDEPSNQAIQLEISGGTFSGNLGALDAKYLQDEDKKLVTGGTFEGGVDAGNLSDDVMQDGNGQIIQKPDVAEVNGRKYKSLQAAINDATDDSIVTLLSDITEVPSVPSGKSLTLDLAGNDIDLGTGTFIINGSLVIKDSTATTNPAVSADYKTVTYASGTIKSSSNDAVMKVQMGGTLILESGTIWANDGCSANGINVIGNQDATSWSSPIHSTLDVKGSYVRSQEYGLGVYGNGATLTMSDGVVVAENNAAIAGNGTVNSSRNSGGTKVSVSGGTIIGRLLPSAVEQGYIACGIYQPQSGTLEISGGTIYADGGAGVVMRAGELDMTGGDVIASGTLVGGVGDKKTDLQSVGIILDNGVPGSYPGASEGAFSVSVSGGSVSSDESLPALQLIPSKDGAAPTPTFEVSGGTFSSKPDENLLAENYVPFDRGDGTYGVAKEGQFYTVTINGEQRRYAEGEFVAEPATPTRAGYTFAGWKTADGKNYDFAVPVTGDLTITSAWTLNVPTVSVAVDNENPVQGETVKLTAAASSDADVNYAYQWLLDGSPIAGETSPTLKVTKPGSYSVHVTATDDNGLTAFAESTPVELTFAPAPVGAHTVTFVWTRGGESTTSVVEDGAFVKPPTAAPEVDGWTFTGRWFTEPECANEFDFEKTPVTEDLTLYAGWVKDGEPGKTPTTPETDADKGGKKTEALAQTSDPTTFLPAIVAGVAGVTTIAGAVVLRKRQR
ncbi:InlB B-repeat-containing protein [Thermophilibacter sp.]